MRNVVVVVVAALLSGCSVRAADVEVGSIDQKVPQKKDLVSPKSDDGITVVGLNETIKGKVPAGEKRNLYVIVNPHSGSDWWVQQVVSRKGESFEADAQFGEGDNGKGEYFTILGVATDKKWSVGEKLSGLPEDATYTKVKVVKRK
jgi:hypothetical protein